MHCTTPPHVQHGRVGNAAWSLRLTPLATHCGAPARPHPCCAHRAFIPDTIKPSPQTQQPAPPPRALCQHGLRICTDSVSTACALSAASLLLCASPCCALHFPVSIPTSSSPLLPAAPPRLAPAAPPQSAAALPIHRLYCRRSASRSCVSAVICDSSARMEASRCWRRSLS